MKRQGSIPAWTRILVLVLTLIGFAMVFPSGCNGPNQAPSGYGYSLRLMTYNVEMVATGETREDKYGMADEDRAEKIAQRILKEEHDIVVLQEVFSDAGRDEFVDELSLFGAYPNYVSELYDDNLFTQDSGLMLFSRYPFEPLPKQEYAIGTSGTGVKGRNNGADIESSCVAFYEYGYTDQCMGGDCWADKGAGLVRVQLPKGEHANIVFTQMQADFTDWDPEDRSEVVNVRESQLNSIQHLIEHTLNPDQIDNEQIYLMGDLNINGNLFNPYHWVGDLYSDVPEWNNRFNSTGFFATVLKDSWAFETLPTDPGQTHGSGFPHFPGGPTEGKRYDYVLYNPHAVTTTGLSPYCVQHLSKAWELADDYGEEFLSDHIPVKADINLWALYCNPLEACPVNLSIENPTQNLEGIITYPGSMQWYRIDEPGTYTFNAVKVDCEVEFDVYESHDLSRPIKSLAGEEIGRGWQFDMPEAPFYIRVFATDRSSHGKYYMNFIKNCGQSPEYAIHLFPAQNLSMYQWPTTWSLNTENAVWFYFSTNVSTKNEYPQLEFTVAVPDPGLEISTPQLLDDDQKIISEPQDTTWTIVGDYQYYGYLMKQDDLPEGKYYLKILPTIPDPKGQKFLIGWETTLTYFRPRTLTCVIQGDTTGDDDIWMLVKTDQAENSYQDYRVYFLGAFDSDSGLEGVSERTGNFIWAFVGHVCVELFEQDGDLDYSDWLFPKLQNVVPVKQWDVLNTDDYYGSNCLEELPLGRNGTVPTWLPFLAEFKDLVGDPWWEYHMLVERAHDWDQMDKYEKN